MLAILLKLDDIKVPFWIGQAKIQMCLKEMDKRVVV